MRARALSQLSFLCEVIFSENAGRFFHAVNKIDVHVTLLLLSAVPRVALAPGLPCTGPECCVVGEVWRTVDPGLQVELHQGEDREFGGYRASGGQRAPAK